MREIDPKKVPDMMLSGELRCRNFPNGTTDHVICYNSGTCRWTWGHGVNWKYWRFPTKQELESAGYGADQITELESRGCVG